RPGVAAMEPCLYRQGERAHLVSEDFDPVEQPQWSPAFIGRESGPVLRRSGSLARPPQWSPAFIGRERVQEPMPEAEVAWQPQWSPAFIGRERPRCAERTPGYPQPQWSPAFIGRERDTSTLAAPPRPGRGRNGALPLSAGRGSKGGAPLWTVTLGPQWSPAFIGREGVYLSSG